MRPRNTSAHGASAASYRLNTLARYGRAAITSTSITRDSLIRQLTAIGRPDMPVLVAPLPADPVFAADGARRPPIGRHPYFVMCGTIEPRKNHLLVLHIWRDLVARVRRCDAQAPSDRRTGMGE